ncbi:uncharacterized protein N7515_010147 [Penicillium bovifimosum]|uniref:Uncharacterized protein n=1 Tax=Penicillium bovifimosum TaxID=126998 RepID=A0A9W9KV05_9EURO|nr:uncharacterized protein N7515_010147 [Penicillium bovifimosum]KAJ5120759.1 hypothetical protein N7515_010147 [Penicillium bovifimosum]
MKGETVEPRDHVKVLSVIMNTRLKYKEHIVRQRPRDSRRRWSFAASGSIPRNSAAAIHVDVGAQW